MALSGCASSGPAPSAFDGTGDGAQFARSLPALLPTDILLIGEQHDAPQHHALELAAVESLTARSRLAALAIEMAEEGRDTTGLPPTATEAQVRAALHWDEAAWPWNDYAATVMAAVRAGVPVVGANLPRSRMKDAMADVSLDAQLPDAALRMACCRTGAGSARIGLQWMHSDANTDRARPVVQQCDDAVSAARSATRPTPSGPRRPAPSS